MNHLNRRSWLSWLGACAIGTLTPASATAVRRRLPQYARLLSLESFRVANADQVGSLHAYLAGSLLEAARRIHQGPQLFLDAILSPETPQVLYITAYSNFDEMLEVRRRIAADSGVRQARADLESTEMPTLDQVRSQVMITTDESLHLHLPEAAKDLASGVFELRAYHAPAWPDGPPNHLDTVFARAGIRPLINASTTVGEHLPRFHYLVPFASLAARQEAWGRLEADSEWIAIQRESTSKHGGKIKVTEKSVYKLAPFSRVS